MSVTRTMNHGIHQLIDVLLVVAGDETLASLMDATLSAEEDTRLDSRAVDVACILFDRLTDDRPDLVPLAQRIGHGQARWCEIAEVVDGG